MFYGIRVNSALARLGVRPAAIPGADRRMLQQAAREARATPQEAALIIAAGLPAKDRSNVSTIQIRTWIAQKKVDPQMPHILDAIQVLSS